MGVPGPLWLPKLPSCLWSCSGPTVCRTVRFNEPHQGLGTGGLGAGAGTLAVAPGPACHPTPPSAPCGTCPGSLAPVLIQTVGTDAPPGLESSDLRVEKRRPGNECCARGRRTWRLICRRGRELRRWV